MSRGPRNPRAGAGLVGLLAALVVALVSASAPPAHAYLLADTRRHQEPGCDILHWDLDGDPVGFRLHHDGSDDFSFWAFEREVRKAFGVWAAVPGAALDFEEGGLFLGTAAYQATEDIDRESVLFFLEDGWAPRAPEVIALTSITFAAGGVILEADIGFNGDDWTFTVSDDDVQVDFLSIAVHEIGHFLGLDHSEEEDATMNARYDEGQIGLRDLTDDDRAGISELYPCDSVPCVGDVGPGCGVVSRLPAREGAALALLVVLLGALGDRRRRARAAAAVGGLLLLMSATPSVGSVVEALDGDRLLDRADLVVRASVRSVEPYLAGKVRSRVTLDVTERWKGLAPDRILLDQLGGRLPDVGTLAFGVPTFRAGDDVVLHLAWPEGGEPRVLGLAQGKIDVAADGSLSQDLSGVARAWMTPRGPTVAVPRPAALPGSVAALRARILSR